VVDLRQNTERPKWDTSLGQEALLVNETVANLPEYLKQYCVDPATRPYTTEEHASWRFIMRQAVDFFGRNSLPIYREGLTKTAVSIDRIPQIAAMDQALRKLGWGAVPVCGFIPPGAFLDFQARKILPIAADMRTVPHIAYTPAPDIVHEAAGHAPILADEDYSN
jgi:phenylalanine-4-hydroxylase